jgi:hypothetical protein
LSTRALWQVYQQDHLGAQQEDMAKEMMNAAYEISLSYIEVFFNMPLNLRTRGRRLYFPSEGRCAEDFYHPGGI